MGVYTAITVDNLTVNSGKASFDSFGYTDEAYGEVTQLTSKSTPVTLNTTCGRIIMDDEQLNNNDTVDFILNNNQIVTNSLVVINVSGGGTPGLYEAHVCCTQEGSARIKLHNIHGNALSEPVNILFAVIKVGP